MNYIIIFDVRGDVVNVVGIFHQLENYPNRRRGVHGKTYKRVFHKKKHSL